MQKGMTELDSDTQSAMEVPFASFSSGWWEDCFDRLEAYLMKQVVQEDSGDADVGG
jgi:hypothetical protein